MLTFNWNINVSAWEIIMCNYDFSIDMMNFEHTSQRRFRPTSRQNVGDGQDPISLAN